MIEEIKNKYLTYLNKALSYYSSDDLFIKFFEEYLNQEMLHLTIVLILLIIKKRWKKIILELGT